MYVPGFSGFQDQRHAGALFGFYQMLVHGGYGEQGGHGHMVFIHAPIRKDQDVRPFSVAAVHLHIQPFDGPLQPGVFIIGDRHHGDPEALLLHAFDLQQVGVGEDRIVHLQHVAVFRFFLQHIPLCADVDGGGSHDMLPDGVDGRIRHLREQLLEGVKQRMMGFA